MMNPIRVYLANGSLEAKRGLEELLVPAGFQVVDKPDPGGALKRNEVEEPGVIILEWPVSATEGFGLLHQIAERYPGWPIISVADGNQVETVARTITQGAADFVIRPLDPDVLAARIRKSIEDSSLRRLATTDGLTQLLNMRAFTLRLQEEIARADRYSRQLSLIMLDIDRFKEYNDSRGHLRGNEVLQQMAQLLREFTRCSDTIARYGGDEFVVILPETEVEQAVMVADRLRAVVERHEFPEQGSKSVQHLTISVGVGCYQMGESQDLLVRRVDQALYQAKGDGRNRVISTP